MKYYFYLSDGSKHTFKNYLDAAGFYKDNSADITDTNFRYL